MREGYYWATSIKRNVTARRPSGGQCGGLRWIVRVFNYGDGSPDNVQLFGNPNLKRLKDYRDYVGPVKERGK